MTSDEAGRLQDAWKAKGDRPCTHARVVDFLRVSKGKRPDIWFVKNAERYFTIHYNRENEIWTKAKIHGPRACRSIV